MKQILIAAALAGVLGTATTPVRADECEPVDFLAIDLPAGDPVKVALETAYPGLKVEEGEVIFTAGAEEEPKKLPLGEIRDIEPGERLKTATVREQFLYPYPLDFDLQLRNAPWADPGRVRSNDFFRALYPGGERQIRVTLETVVYPGLRLKPRYAATERFCAHVQLRAALEEIGAMGHMYDKYFENPGGSFAWREIAGTNRLSAHSFGIAIDINSTLGQYWKWAGWQAGDVREYRNQIPEEIVRTFERRGFIWGGKWHHYDGMHFEFRPELILFARLIRG